MIPRVLIIFLLILPFFFTLSLQEKNVDPYKVLGVDRSANQREIQKAFHKLSLKYHPDKNKNKGAQEKFAEINNAYEILSDDDKRKNYDLYGDARRSTGLNEDNFGNPDGYTYFTGGPGGPGGGGPFTVGSQGWQKMSGQGNSKSFSFSFGGEPGSFDMGDIFSNFFRTSGNVRGNHHGGGVSSSGPRSNLNYPASGIIQNIGSQSFKEKVRDQGITWLLLFYAPSTRGYDVHESLIEDVATSLHGALKAGKVNCQSEWALCRDLVISPSRSALIFIYAYGSSGKDSLLEYNDDFDAKRLKTFCLNHLPRVSKRADISSFEFPDTNENLPQVLLLSTKKDTPSMWRVLSGLYQKRFAFYDAEVRDVSDPSLKKYGIEALPALVGRMSNGDVHVLKAGIAVKDLQSGVNQLKSLLESFERKNIATSPPSKKAESRGKNVPLLTALNADSLCGKSTPLCIIGVFRSEKARRKLENLLLALSRKTLVRKQSGGADCGDSISYVLLDALKQSQALNSFDWSGFRNLDKLLLAYKPRKGKFVIFTGEHTMEEVEKFIGSVLNGDVVFSKTRYNPDFS